ncbi:1,4-alpha-glucan branching enzyme GlgB [Planctomycetales bacterium]|nr:1,4-alpha-glucan branching enzyme GlgB [Planctomycetales bacterium]
MSEVPAAAPALSDDELRRDYPYRYWGAHAAPDKTVFRVYAPNATSVRLLHARNNWAGDAMTRLPDGTWEATVGGDLSFVEYKYDIENTRAANGGYRMGRIDPFSPRLVWSDFNGQRNFNSIVGDGKPYPWVKKHLGKGTDPMAIYEMHLGGFLDKNYRDIAVKIAEHLDYLGFTHVQIMPPFQTPIHESWGYLVGCPYALNDRYGTVEDFKWLVDYLHQKGLGVIVDVPMGFGIKDWDCGLACYDGTELFHHQGERGWNRQWDTRIYRKGDEFVKNYLCGLLTYCYEELGIDGARLDAVSSMIFFDYDRGAWDWPRNDREKVPAEYWEIFNGIGGDMKLNIGYWLSEATDFEGLKFLQDLHLRLRYTAPDFFTIAEDSRRVFPKLAAPIDRGGLGFAYAQNMGEMHRVRKYLTLPEKEKRIEVIERLMTAPSEEKFVNAMNTHDECANGKTRLITELKNHLQLIGLAALCWFRAGAPMLFMGDEFCEDGWFDVYRGLDWGKTGPGAKIHEQEMTNNIHDLNYLLRREKALARHDSWTLERAGSNNERMFFSFIRWGGDAPPTDGAWENHQEDIIFVRNEAPHHVLRAEINAPVEQAEYQVIYNSVDERYIGRQGYNDHNPYWTVWSNGHRLSLDLLPYQNLALKLKK